MEFKSNIEFGRWGEEKAKFYVKENGYKIIEENFRISRGEIDLIAEKENTIIFIEVKTRKNSFFGPPQSAVNWKKQNKIKKIARCFLVNNNYKDYKKRFDVIAIIYNKKNINIEHYKNSF